MLCPLKPFLFPSWASKKNNLWMDETLQQFLCVIQTNPKQNGTPPNEYSFRYSYHFTHSKSGSSYTYLQHPRYWEASTYMASTLTNLPISLTLSSIRATPYSPICAPHFPLLQETHLKTLTIFKSLLRYHPPHEAFVDSPPGNNTLPLSTY